MKMFVHRTPSEGNPQPFELNRIKDHARVDHEDEDIGFMVLGWTAASEIEHVAQIALLTQTIRVTVFQPCRDSFLSLPIGPAYQTEGVTVTLDGVPFTGFEFVPGNRPAINWGADYHDLFPTRLQVEYQAGFGPAVQYIPLDLQLAVADQAALIYDNRAGGDGKALTSSPHMARIAARYRGLRA